MDTSNSPNPLHVRVTDLKHSSYLEDQAQAEEFTNVLSQLITAILPVLRYVCTPETLKPRAVHCVYIADFWCSLAENCMLFLTDKGKFFAVRKAWLQDPARSILCVGKTAEMVLAEGTNDWERVYFDDVIRALKAVFATATKKREEHLQGLRAREEMLHRVLAAIKQ